MYSPVKIQQNVFVFCTLNCFYTTVRIFIKNPQINTIARQVYVFRMSDVSGALSLVRYLRYFYYFHRHQRFFSLVRRSFLDFEASKIFKFCMESQKWNVSLRVTP